MRLKSQDGQTVQAPSSSVPGITPAGSNAYLWKTGSGLIPFYGYRQRNEIYLWMAGRSYRFELLHSPETQLTAGIQQDDAWVKAPMPGKILKILVKLKETVKPGQGLIIMESMKMEMTLSAPAGGQVSEITAGEGGQVKIGQALIRLRGLFPDS